MKKTLMIIATMLTGMATIAQTMNIRVGNVTYQFPAAQAGEMTYSDGTSLTVMGRTFTLADITSMTVDETAVTDNLVNIVYNTSGDAQVSMAGNVAQYVEASVSGNHVTLTQLSSFAGVDATSGNESGEITYQLSGASTDGSLTLGGSYKCTVQLAGVTLTNPSGAAINITNSKRIQLSAKKGTENTLTDGASGSQKACIYSKGQLQLQGNGTLNVVGRTKHGIKSASYIEVKNLTLNITQAAGDGINCEEYLLVKSGNISLSGLGDDGIQCDLDGTTSTGETTGHEDEDSGNIYIEGGTLKVNITAAAAKGIKAGGELRISDGTLDVTTTGSGAYDSDEKDAKGCACLKSDGNMTISGGTLTLKSTGTGGKCIKADGTLAISGGTITAASTGSQYRYSSSATASPKCIKSDGAMTISGGTITASSSNHEGIESKSTLDINGGYVCATAKDDAINSASHMTVSGGYVMANSTGNDGMDANGNFYIKGGNVVAIAASQPEVALDANTESRYQLYITGGNVVAIGGFENGSSISGGTAKQASSASSYKGKWLGLTNGSTQAFAFKVPSNSSMGSNIAVYTSGTPTLTTGVTGSGTTFWDGSGSTAFSGGSSISLSDYSSNQGGGPGGGGPGGGRWW